MARRNNMVSHVAVGEETFSPVNPRG